MSDSNKARFGTNCKKWKDTVLASKSQKKAYTRFKRKRSRKERHAENLNAKKEIE